MSVDFDVAVVLGAAIGPDGTASPALLRRIDTAVSLFRQGRVGCLLMSGGGTPSEASLMRARALAAGLPGTALLLEERSRSTLENAQFCKPIIEERAWRRLLLVTDRYHLRRALYTFGRFGLPADGIGAPPQWNMALVAASLREMAAMCVYPGRIRRALAASARYPSNPRNPTKAG